MIRALLPRKQPEPPRLPLHASFRVLKRDGAANISPDCTCLPQHNLNPKPPPWTPLSFPQPLAVGIPAPHCGDTSPSLWGHQPLIVGTPAPRCGDTSPSLWGHQPLAVGTPAPHCGDTRPSTRGHQPLDAGTPAPRPALPVLRRTAALIPSSHVPAPFSTTTAALL